MRTVAHNTVAVKGVLPGTHLHGKPALQSLLNWQEVSLPSRPARRVRPRRLQMVQGKPRHVTRRFQNLPCEVPGAGRGGHRRTGKPPAWHLPNFRLRMSLCYRGGCCLEGHCRAVNTPSQVGRLFPDLSPWRTWTFSYMI